MSAVAYDWWNPDLYARPGEEVLPDGWTDERLIQKAMHSCYHCARITLEPRGINTLGGKIFDIGTNCEMATKAAESGCRFFQFAFSHVWTNADSVQLQLMLPDSAEMLVDFNGDTRKCLGTSYWDEPKLAPPWTQGDVPNYLTWNKRGSPKLNVYAHKNDPASSIIESEPYVADLRQPALLQQAGVWLRRCFHGHKSCHPPRSIVSPSRLLKIINVQGETTVRLVTSRNKIKGQPYAAISYCWGGDQPKATQDLLPRLKSGIKIIELAQTIQDAVIVAQNLSVHYIWVDALCIIQDDEMDKLLELAKMANIYQGALVTIIVGSAERSSQGFLDQREDVPSFKIRIRSPSGTMGSVLLVPSRNDDPVNTRAWTLQEGILSNRLLYFSNNRISWQCLKAKASYPAEREGCINDLFYIRNRSLASFSSESEKFVKLYDDHIASIGQQETPGAITCKGQKVLLEEIRSTQLRDNDFGLLEEWFQIVNDYSKRNITFPSDKLLAIAGVAQEFARGIYRRERFSGQYLAGLWNCHLAHNLLWFCSGCRKPRPRTWRAPSWSWAAVDSEVSWLICHRNLASPSLEIIETRTSTSSVLVPFGAVTSGYIKAKGRMKQILYSLEFETKNQSIVLSDQAFGIHIHRSLDCLEGSPQKPYPFGPFVWVLEVLQNQNFNSDAYPQGLVLARNDDMTFRRIAILWINGTRPERLDDWFNSFTLETFVLV